VQRLDPRLLLSQLADRDTRTAAGWWLLAFCAAGFAVTLGILVWRGAGLDRWVFVLLVWGVLVFVPLRIALESMQTLGVGMRHAVAGRVSANPRRYDDPIMLPVTVRALAERDALLPRICLPQHARQAREAATALVARTGTGAAAASRHRRAIAALVAATADEAAALSASATGSAADNIQARWDAARALGALGALVRILVAAYTDRWGVPPAVPELAGRDLREYLDALLDYCDEAALQVDALPWTEPPLDAEASHERLEEVRQTWRAFLAAGLPAPRALEAFVSTVLADAEG
jgi:hypothetical protein